MADMGQILLSTKGIPAGCHEIAGGDQTAREKRSEGCRDTNESKPPAAYDEACRNHADFQSSRDGDLVRAPGLHEDRSLKRHQD